MAIRKLHLVILLFLFAGLVTGTTVYLRNRLGLNVIPFTQAAMFVGQEKTVEGTLARVFNNRQAVYLDFGDPHEEEVALFRVRILKEFWPNFTQPPEKTYQVGDKIWVTGKIEWYQGDPIISVTRPDQIQASKK